MDYHRLEETLQGHFRGIMPLSEAQIRRITLLCRVIYVAGRLHLTFLARNLPIHSQQDSRVRWIRRLLGADFMRAELVYQPVVRQLLKAMKLPCWHLIIDRTALVENEVDLVTISLHYHKRAVPLIWQSVPYGGAPLATYTALVKVMAAWVPQGTDVIFHGDTEFGGADMIRTLRELGWDFILAQRKSVHFRRKGEQHTQPLASLSAGGQLANVDLFAKDLLGVINIVAFPQRRYTKTGRLKRVMCYLATSLPLTRPIRRLGRRRWGIEPFHKDYKSSGWRLDESQLQKPALREGLLIVLALCYSLSVCIGRWLCKTGQRAWIDSHPRRHLSLFRLGWDCIVHCVNCYYTIPFRLRLYP